MPGGKDSISGVSVCMLSSENLLTVLECSYSEEGNAANYANYAEEVDDLDLGTTSCGRATYDMWYRPRQRKVRVLCGSRQGSKYSGYMYQWRELQWICQNVKMEWWRRGSNSRGIAPIGNQEILKSDALDQLGHATFLELCSHPYIYLVHPKWIVFTFPRPGLRATHPAGAETESIPYSRVSELANPRVQVRLLKFQRHATRRPKPLAALISTGPSVRGCR